MENMEVDEIANSLSAQFEQMKLERDLALAKCDELSAQFEQMKLERDLALAERDRAFNQIIWPSANVHFEDEHIGQGQEENLVEDWLAEDVPQRSVDYLNYDVMSINYLNSQRKAMRRWNDLTNLQKRIFQHYFLMSRESQAFEVNTEDQKLNLSWAVYLNFFITLAKSIGEIVPNGCWIVREDAQRHTLNNRPIVISFNANIIHSARVVCFFKYNSQALKGNHASHLCNNPNCINDKHIVPESATSNERRNECFKIGSASNCQCVPGCLFVRNGHLLPCRNNLDLSECICEENCFREVILERERRDRIQQNRRAVEPGVEPFQCQTNRGSCVWNKS
ncbi:hypothetical protein M3Y97_00888800 [Aphelenchoides bicaudatus]|nr:hypothetical protein M3Y97_00888800 [Aphelenchoides bicaudatus]